MGLKYFYLNSVGPAARSAAADQHPTRNYSNLLQNVVICSENYILEHLRLGYIMSKI